MNGDLLYRLRILELAELLLELLELLEYELLDDLDRVELPEDQLLALSGLPGGEGW